MNKNDIEDLFYNVAFSLWEEGKIKESKVAYEFILKANPNHTFSLNDLCSILLEEGKVKEGRTLLEKAFRIDPTDKEIYNNTETLRKAYWDCINNKIESPYKVNPYKKENKIKVAIVYDVVGWAWWHRAWNIAREISDDIEISLIKKNSYLNHTLYDFIVIFDAYVEENWPNLNVPKEKIIIGCSNTRLIEQTINIVKKKNFKGAVINNAPIFLNIKDKSRYYCCQNGVDEDLFYPSKEIPDEFLACWVGNTNNCGEKGLDIIREGCKLANVNLLMLDSNSINHNIQRAPAQDWLRDNLYHKASCFICASKHEGTPNPALESLACGNPVITTRVGNMPEIITEGYNGYFIERNAYSLKEKLLKLKSQDLKVFRRHARESILNGWTWKAQSKKYENMFKDLYKENNSFSSLNKPLKALFISDSLSYKDKMPIDIVNQIKELSELVEVSFFGPGWFNWDSSKSLNKNYKDLNKDFDIAISYIPLEVKDFFSLNLPKCRIFKEHKIEKLLDDKSSLIVLENENDKKILNSPNAIYIGHFIDPIFFNQKKIKKDIDILFLKKEYKNPLELKFLKVVENLKNLNYKVYTYSDFKNITSEEELENFSNLAKRSKITLSSLSNDKKSLKESINVLASGSVLISDTPLDDANDYLSFIEYVGDSMSEEQIEEKIVKLLKNEDKLKSKKKMALKFSNLHTSKKYAFRLYQSIMHYLKKD